MLALVVMLSTLHLAVLIAQEIWTPPRFLIRVQGLLEIFGYFLLVLIEVELLSVKAVLDSYPKPDRICAKCYCSCCRGQSKDREWS
jgi:uncharacterized membrane protein (DUF373 family)